MGKTECCADCIEFYQKTISRYWGSKRVVEIPGCDSCLRRHDAEVSKLKADLQGQKERYDTDLSKSAQDLLTQKRSYEELISVLKTNSSVEVNQLKADNNKHRSMVKFLQSSRDSIGRDVVLEAPGCQVSANLAILAARSAVFQKVMIPSGNAEHPAPPTVIQVEDTSPPVLESIVDFCYSGEFTFSELAPPDEVLRVAHRFELPFLKELCDDELCRGVTVDNVPEMLKLSRKFSAIKLQDAAGKVFKDHFDILKDRVYGVFEGPDK